MKIEKGIILLKCPFCNSNPITYQEWTWVECSNINCEVQGPVRGTRIEALIAWNKRHKIT